jgi:thiol:disulfide interchange protein
VVSAQSPAGTIRTPHKQRDEAPLAWEHDEPEARERARRQHLPLLVYLRAEWSVASLELERGIWSDPAVRRAARRFVAVKIDVSDAEADAEFWARRYGARGVPTTVLVDGEGRTAATLHGAFTAEELLRALEQVD